MTLATGTCLGPYEILPPSAPAMLLKDGSVFAPAGNSGRTYDVSPDGRRFLMIKVSGGSDQTNTPAQVIVVQHWTEELKRLVPTK
jgi:hypothetical protein